MKKRFTLIKKLFSILALLQIFAVSKSVAQTSQYASTIIGYSSQYGATNWAAAQAIGAPNVTGCGDIGTAWASASPNGQREFLAFGFSGLQKVSTITIYETYNPGAIDTIYLRDGSNGQWNIVYSGTASTTTVCPRLFTVNITQTTYDVNGIRLAINSPAVAGYNEIDAIQVTGTTILTSNLILNPSCDEPLVSGEIPSWQETVGTNWTQRCSDPFAYAGSCYFYAGTDAIDELAQTINVSSYSANIDAGTQYFYFTGYVRSYSQGTNDESNIFIRFHNSVDTLLTSNNFGPYIQDSIWMRVTATLLAPVGTRNIKIRLHTVRHTGTNNDGYYDELYLGTTPLAGIAENLVQNSISIFPNPTSNLLNIKGIKGKSTIRVYDLLGKMVLEKEVIDDTSIETNQLSHGIYTLIIQNNSGKTINKFIIN